MSTSDMDFDLPVRIPHLDEIAVIVDLDRGEDRCTVRMESGALREWYADDLETAA